MEILYVIAVLIIAYYINVAYHWVLFKNKYPILSSSFPLNILEAGDVVYLEERKYTFYGISRTDGLWYMLMPDDSITCRHFDYKYAENKIDSVYGKYGIKWKRVN